MLYRDHRGGLAESLLTVREFSGTRADLIDLLRKNLDEFFPSHGLDLSKITVEPYYPDERIGWMRQHIVHLAGYGVFGFTDGPLVDSELSV